MFQVSQNMKHDSLFLIFLYIQDTNLKWWGKQYTPGRGIRQGQFTIVGHVFCESKIFLVRNSATRERNSEAT